MQDLTKTKKILLGGLFGLMMVGIGVTTLMIQRQQDIRQRASVPDLLPWGVPGKADLTFTPQNLIAKTGNNYELDLIAGFDGANTGKPPIAALSFVLNIPKDKITEVVFEPSPVFEPEGIATNAASTDETKWIFTGYDLNEKLNQPYQLNTHTKAKTPTYLGRLKFKAAVDFVGQLTFERGEIGLASYTMFNSSASSSSNNTLTLHPSNLTIKSTAQTISSQIIDALPTNGVKEFGPLDRVLVVRSFSDETQTVSKLGGSGRNIGEEFVDTNLNGIYDQGEDFNDGDQDGKYTPRELLKGGASFKLTGPFTGQARDIKQVLTDVNGNSVVDGLVGEPNSWSTYIMSDLAGPADYKVSIHPNFNFFPGQMNTVEISMVPFVTVRGVTYVDTNRNNQKDTAEPTVGNVNLSITNTDPAINKTATSSAAGEYSIGVLPPNMSLYINIIGSATSTYNSGTKQFQTNDSPVILDIPVTLKPNVTLPPIDTTVTSTPNPTATTVPNSPTPTPIGSRPTTPPCTPGAFNGTECPTPSPTPIPNATTAITPTGTPAPGANVSLTLRLPGIGSEFGSNNAPKRTTRTATVALFGAIGANGQPVSTASATAAVSYANGTYSGLVPMGTLPTGSYEAKVKLENTLWKRIPGILIVSSGTQVLTISALDLIPGDISGTANLIDVSDYNAALSCYTGTCAANIKALADFNDDNAVGLGDLNILLRSFVNRQGD